MKKQVVGPMVRVSIVALSVLVATSLSAHAKKPVQVFLLGGQSNMVGAGQTADLKPPYTDALPGVQLWDQKTKTWMPLAPAPVKFGPEISFGHAIAKVLPGEDIRLVKYAAGGTALYNDWAPTTGGQYTRFMTTARAALADLDAAKVQYEIAGMLWLQGESDAHEHKAETYEKNIIEFIAHMRAQFKTPEMPFVMARVLAFYGGKSGQAKIVRDAQVKVAESTEGVEWFDTDDCPIVDPVKNRGHYNADGLVEIGKRFAAAFKPVKAE